MKKVIDISWLSAFTFFMLLTLSSCLEAGLDELESYNDAEIRGFKFEHRWEQTINGGNNTQLGVVSLPTNVKIEEILFIAQSLFLKLEIPVFSLRRYAIM